MGHIQRSTYDLDPAICQGIYLVRPFTTDASLNGCLAGNKVPVYGSRPPKTQFFEISPQIPHDR